MENRIYITGRKGNRARARRNQKEKKKVGEEREMESGEEVRLCVQIHARLRWLNDASCELAECFFFLKVLRSEWQSGKEDLSSCPRALYSLGFFLFFLVFFAFLFTTTATVWSLARLHSPYLTCHDVRPLPVSPLSCLMYHVELHTVAITKPLADWEQKACVECCLLLMGNWLLYRPLALTEV